MGEEFLHSAQYGKTNTRYDNDLRLENRTKTDVQQRLYSAR
jgi:hypothetical protein